MKLLNKRCEQTIYTVELTQEEVKCLGWLVNKGIDHHNFFNFNDYGNSHNIERTHFHGIDMTEVLRFLKV